MSTSICEKNQQNLLIFLDTRISVIQERRGRELCNSILCFAMATKNHCGDLNLLFDVVQRFTQTLPPKDMARSPREKQRERDVFEAFLTVRQGRIEFQSFAKSFVVSTFTAQKKPVG